MKNFNKGRRLIEMDYPVSILLPDLEQLARPDKQYLAKELFFPIRSYT